MVTVLLNKELGLTIATMPNFMFTYLNSNINEDRVNGTIAFDTAASATQLTEMVNSLTQVLGFPVQLIMKPGYHEVTKAPVVQNEGIIEDLERCGNCGDVLEDCGCDRCGDCGELEEECTCTRAAQPARTQVEFRNVETQGNSSQALQSLANQERIADNSINTVIASKLNSDVAGRAKILSDKILYYNRTMTSLLIMQNEIASLGRIIESNEIVQKMSEQLKKLTKSDMIEDAYLTINHLMIKTKEIISNPLSDGKQRKIGKMDFIINLKCLLGVNMSDAPTILFRNRTRESTGSAYTMQCGHVNDGGYPCFGSWTEPIIKALHDLDLLQLVDILVRFVRTPNLQDSMGIDLLQWPIAEETK